MEIKDVLVASNLYLCNNFMKIYYSIPSIYDKSWPTNEEKNKDGWFIRANSIPSFIFFFFFFLFFSFFFLPSGKFQFIRDTSLSFLLILYPDYCYCWLADRETSEEDRRRGKGEWNSWSGLNSGNCIFRRKARRLWTLGNYSWPSKVNWRTQK